MRFRAIPRERFDALLAIALCALFVFEVFSESGFGDKRALALVTGLPFCASIGWRRRFPVVPVALAVVVIEVSNLAGPQALGDSGSLLFGLVIAIYSAGAYAEGPQLPASLLL